MLKNHFKSLIDPNVCLFIYFKQTHGKNSQGQKETKNNVKYIQKTTG